MTSNGKMCFWERVAIQAGFQLVHDGSHSPGELQRKLGATETKFYTRKYRWFLDGQPVNTWVKFVYDDRELHDMVVSYKDGEDKGEIFKEGTNEHQG